MRQQMLDFYGVTMNQDGEGKDLFSSLGHLLLTCVYTGQCSRIIFASANQCCWMWLQMDREIKLSFSVTQEMRLSLDSPLFCHSFLPAFKIILSRNLIGVCFSLPKYAAPLWEFPLRVMAMTLEGIKVAFPFWWLWPPICMHPGGAT